MRIITLPLLTLTPLPALAQDRWQVCLGLDSQPEQSVSYRLDQTYARFEQEARVAPSLQVGYRFLELAKSDLSLTAETQFKSRSDTRFLAAGDGPVQEVRGKSHQRYVAPGIQWTFHRFLDYGFGLQYRFARLEAGTLKVNHHRTWANAYLGRGFTSRRGFRPFVGLRFDLALNQTSAPGTLAELATPAGMERMLRAMDPDAQTTFLFGVRF